MQLQGEETIPWEPALSHWCRVRLRSSTAALSAQAAIFQRGNSYNLANLANVVLSRWTYCRGRHIVQMAILHRWPHCAGGHITQVDILHRSPYCPGRHTDCVYPRIELPRREIVPRHRLFLVENCRCTCVPPSGGEDWHHLRLSVLDGFRIGHRWAGKP